MQCSDPHPFFGGSGSRLKYQSGFESWAPVECSSGFRPLGNEVLVMPGINYENIDIL
jgi:hypothetical protein